MTEEKFSILNTTRSIPRNIRGIAFNKIKDEVVGKNYELSFVIIGSKLSRKLNRENRGKDKPANVLSFPLTNTSGEIFIDIRKAEDEWRKFDESFPTFVTRLFIHGLLHLKGMQHGDTMDKAENKFLRKFDISQK